MRVSASTARKLDLLAPKKRQKKSPLKAKLEQEERRLFDGLCVYHGLPIPEHEVLFAKSIGRRYRADWVFTVSGMDYTRPFRLIVEKDGEIYGKGAKCSACGRRSVGAHSSITQQKKDRKRDRVAVLLGFSVVRFLPEEFSSGQAFKEIKEILESYKGKK